MPSDGLVNEGLAESSTASAIGRRGFLQWVSATCAAIITMLAGLPVIRALVSPTLAAAPPETWVKVADDIALLDIGVPVRLDFTVTQQDSWVESRALNSVWLFTEDGEKFKAYNGHCTHLGCGYTYDKELKTFACPCHRGQFDVKTGRVLTGPPPRGLDELPVKITDSAVYVNYKEFRLGVPERVEA
jgi:menaquinol-cytochrome c reductase iron-sulfur subunit